MTPDQFGALTFAAVCVIIAVYAVVRGLRLLFGGGADPLAGCFHLAVGATIASLCAYVVITQVLR